MKATSIVFALMIMLTASVGNHAFAGIYKCIDSSGGISYSSQECPVEERTAKVMSNTGRSGSEISCTVADAFIRKTATDMRNGVSSDNAFSQYGGLRRIPKTALNMINYIYTYQENLSAVPSRIIDLTLQKCTAGNFGVPTCNSLPASFINENGGCIADKVSKQKKKERDLRQSTYDESEE